MCGDMSPLHHMHSLLVAEVSTGTTLPFMSVILYFYIIQVIDRLLNFKLLLESQRCKCSIFTTISIKLINHCFLNRLLQLTVFPIHL